MDAVEIRIRHPALMRQRLDAPLLGRRLIERRLRRAALGFGLFELQAQVRVVEARERVAPLDHGAGVDEALAILPATRKPRSLSMRALTTPGSASSRSRGA